MSSLTVSNREFREVWDRIGRNSQNQVYTCMVRMILQSWYITWKGHERGGIEKPRTRRLRNKSLKEELWTLD